MIARPLRLPNGSTLRNRIAKSATSEQLSDARHAPTRSLIRLYERWGRSGAALLITGNVMVDRRALGEPGNVVVEDGRDLLLLARWARAAEAGGAQAWMQINHPGRQSPRNLSREPVAPSEVPMEGTGGTFAKPRALREEEIGEILRRFAASASLAQRAGFSGVQIHAAHGYLIGQFLSPRTNRRDDAWGGDPPRRMRFLLEAVRAVRSAVGREFAVGVKLNSADFQRGGFSADESLEVVRALNREGIDLLEISGGTYERAAMWSDGIPASRRTLEREAYFLDYAERVRGISQIPLMLTGGLRTAAGMRSAVERGGVDVVGLARPMIVEPDLPRRLLAGETTGALPVRLRLGIPTIDNVVEGFWYQWQIRRMGFGLSPRPKASRLAALHTAVRTMARACLDAGR